MRVSQLLHTMDKEVLITILDAEKTIANHLLYEGDVRGITRDNPINGYHVTKIFAYDDIVVAEVKEPKSKYKELQQCELTL